MGSSFVIRRLLQIIPLFLAVMVLIFLLVHLIPGDPVSTLLGDRATPDIVRAPTVNWGWTGRTWGGWPSGWA